MGATAKLVAAMILGKMKRYKDEKGDVSTKEMLKGVFDETLASMAGNVLLGSEIYQFAESVITGGRLYDVESPSVSTINGIMQNSQSFIRSIQDYVTSDKDEREQNRKKVKKNAYYLSLNVSQATSIPLKNVLDLSNAVVMQATSIFEGRELKDWYFKESDVKESKFYDKIFQDIDQSEKYLKYKDTYKTYT